MRSQYRRESRLLECERGFYAPILKCERDRLRQPITEY